MKVDFLGVPIDALTMKETIEQVDNAVQSGLHISHVVVNAGKIVMMQDDPMLFKSVTSCDMINADGQSIVWASRLFGRKIPERVAGADLMIELIRLSHERNYRIFLLGGKDEVVSKVVRIIDRDYKPSIIAGYRNGYFEQDQDAQIAQQIKDSGAQLLFVAISSPRKENFLYEYRDVLGNVNFTMGVGGTFDVIAGVTKRAPKWMQRAGMEWFFRLLQEPLKMWKRYTIGNIKFLWLVFVQVFKERIKIFV